MVCKGLCKLKYEGTNFTGGGGVRTPGKSVYSEGYMYCKHCDIFIKNHTKTYHCLCCGYKVRKRPNNYKSGQKFRDKILNVVRY